LPITRQIVDQVRARCASGDLAPGERMPSVRELARDLAINQNTVLRVYEKLTAEGFLTRRHGEGTFVADRLPAGRLRAQREALRDELARLVRRARTLGVDADELRQLLDRALSDVPAKDPSEASS
jgi:GntR family transcriptional regulator